jgi:hypothetical protein
MGRGDRIVVPGAQVPPEMQPNIPMEILARADLAMKLGEIAVRILAGCRPEDAAALLGVTFRPPLGQEVAEQEAKEVEE